MDLAGADGVAGRDLPKEMRGNHDDLLGTVGAATVRSLARMMLSVRSLARMMLSEPSRAKVFPLVFVVDSARDGVLAS